MGRSISRSSTTRSRRGGGSQWDDQYAECKLHGRYRSYWVDESGEFHFASCPECAKRQKAAQFIDLSIAPRFRECTVQNWKTPLPEMKKVREEVSSWCRSIDAKLKRGACIVMSGESGTGKTHLASAICMHALRKGYTAKLLKASEFFEEIFKTYEKQMPGEPIHPATSEVMNTFADIDLLILDDLGASSADGHRGDLLFDLLDRRYNLVRSTIITSNLPIENRSNPKLSVRGYLGGKAARRIFENCLELRFSWKPEVLEGAK